MKKSELEEGTIYPLKNGFDGLKVCVLKSNRNNADKNKKMLAGCLETGMQQPGIFTDARLAFDAGYTLLDAEDGHLISQKEVLDYLVIVDGNTRLHAWLMSLQAKTPFTYLFHYKKYKDAKTFKKTYQTINIYNTPTSTADFARDFEATTDNSVVAGYRKKQQDGLCPKASGFATIGREIVKADLVKLQKGEVPAGFEDEEAQTRFTKIYEAVLPSIAATPAIFKGTEVWKYNVSKLKDATDKDEMTGRLCKLYSTLPYAYGKRLEKARKAGVKTKEAVVAEILEEALAKIS